MTFHIWRRIHIAASVVLAVFAIVHSGLTFHFYEQWTPDAVWFLGAGLGLLLLAVVNRAHVGLGPCDMPTAPVIRWANVLFAAFGIAAATAVREPQGYVVSGVLIGQAWAGFFTLTGPSARAAEHHQEATSG